MNKITGYLFATKMEAKPFISGLDLRRVEKKPFEIYAKDQSFLILSGIGKTNAALAAEYLILKYQASRLFNIGAAGAAAGNIKLGEIYHINKVIEYDRPKLLTKGMRVLKPDILRGFNTASLATQDKPVVAALERQAVSKHADLVDMEGAAVIHACRLWDVKCYLFKIITDTPEHKELDIIKNVRNTASLMYEFFLRNIL